MEHVTKASRVMEALNTNPHRADREIADEIGCTLQYVGQIRRKMAHVPSVELCAHGHPDTPDDQCEQCWHEAADEMMNRIGEEEPFLPIDLNHAPTQDELEDVLETVSILNQDTINAILEERGSRYGAFITHAIITQRLKAVMADTPNWFVLEDDMKEALEMVAHKIGRILNGDPTYVDNVIDIIGYMQLVLDRMNGEKERGIQA